MCKSPNQKISMVLFILMLCTILSGVFIPTASAADSSDAIYTYRLTPGDTASPRYTMKANGTPVFVTEYSNELSNNAHVARFASESGTPTIEITNDAPITSVRIHPERYYPESGIVIDGNKVTFHMSDELRYIFVEVNGLRPHLGIINDPPEDEANIPDPNAPNVLNVMDFVTDNTGVTDMTTQFTAAINELYSNSAYDTLYIPYGSYKYNGLTLQNRTKPVTIYTEEGVLLKNRYTLSGTRGSISSTINVNGSKNITFYGRGIYDANGFEGWNRLTGIARAAGVYVRNSENITFNDTYMRDSGNWSWTSHTSYDIAYNNIKGLTPSAGSWIDGLNITSGQNITVDGAFVIGNDDAFATGHYNSGGSGEDACDTQNIVIKNTLHWTCNAGNAARFGHSANNYALKDYYFENFNAVGFRAGEFGISVQNDTGTYPRYESIEFVNSSFHTELVFTNFSILGATGDRGGQIDNVKLVGCWFSHFLPSRVQNVKNLTIKDLYIEGKQVKSYGAAALTLANVSNMDTDMAENYAPVFAPVTDITTTVGQPATFTVSATDPEGDAITYSVADLPNGATFDPETKQFSWTPKVGQFGWYPVTIHAMDENSYTPLTVNVFVESDNIVKLTGEIFGRTQEADEKAHPPEHAFDGDINTYYYGQKGGYAGMKLDKAYTLLGYRIMVGANNNFRILFNQIQGSNDGENWDTLDTIWYNPPVWPNDQMIWFKLDKRPEKTYTQYRIYSGGHPIGGPYTNPGELEFFGYEGSLPVDSTPDINVTADKTLLFKGDYFNISAEFKNEEVVNSNVSSVTYSYDKAKFDYRGFTEAEGWKFIDLAYGEDSVTIKLMNLNGYGLSDIGRALFSAKEDVDLENETSIIGVSVQYVVKDENGSKRIETAVGSVSIDTTNGGGSGEDGEYTLIDLSNLIDLFGTTKNDDKWAIARFFDFNGNGEIDISDISTLAAKIKFR